MKIHLAGTMVPAYHLAGTMVPAYDLAETMVWLMIGSERFVSATDDADATARSLGPSSRAVRIFCYLQRKLLQ
jgi:hypothetical protein